jgi:hypothetical protein
VRQHCPNITRRSGAASDPVACKRGSMFAVSMQMTDQQAFEAMRLFLEHFYSQAGNDMETLLTDISVRADGGTLDPAAWHDWLRCVRAATGESDPA